MKGPTGCGKTEIARRIANLASAPFVKVEATRYTEIGIVGANTHSMIKDLLDIGISLERERAYAKVKEKSLDCASRDLLVKLEVELTNENFEKMKNGGFDDQLVEIPNDILMSNKKSAHRSSENRSGDEAADAIQNMISDLGGGIMNFQIKSSKTKTSSKKYTVAEARREYTKYHSDQLIDENEIIRAAKEKTEQEGIVFIDEIDKLSSGASSMEGARGHQLREGVQKELLSLLEGCTVSTRYGSVSTNHILFIASGAFHQSAVSDLLPELQGRLPVRVELKSLNADDLRRVLVDKKYNLVAEATAMLATEGLRVEFTDCAIAEIARFAFVLNSSKANIGARRLTGVMQTVVEEISFIAHRLKGTTQRIDRAYVQSRMKVNDPTSEENLSKYIL